MRHLVCIVAFIIFLPVQILAQPDFTAYYSNPIIPVGAAGAWDEGIVISPGITVVNDTFYMAYMGTSNFQTEPLSIGLATSTDGVNFTKSTSNPILSGDGSGFNAYSVGGGLLVYDNNTWNLYYLGNSSTTNIPGNVISRATADNPHGPWTKSNDTLLTAGSGGEWDSKFVVSEQIIATDTGLVMFYWAGDDWYPNTYTAQIGMAVSSDNGKSWQKYDNPLTTNSPFAESDPVLTVGSEGTYDAVSIYGATVIKNASQWEMYYLGASFTDTDGICYATSPDGISWTKHAGNPIFTFWEDPAVINILEMPSAVIHNDTCFLYYDYGTIDAGIGLATAINPPGAIENIFENYTRDFILYPNYPNPFNPITVISYHLAVSSNVEINIYNTLGKKVATLVSEKKQAGQHQVTWDASGQASGVYFYQLKAGRFSQTKKLLFIQ
jgi:hypothetical protein